MDNKIRLNESYVIRRFGLTLLARLTLSSDGRVSVDHSCGDADFRASLTAGIQALDANGELQTFTLLDGEAFIDACKQVYATPQISISLEESVDRLDRKVRALQALQPTA